MGPIGWPAPSCMEMSISLTVASLRSTMRRACIKLGTRRRLTMNPGVSPQLTATFPMSPTQLYAFSKTAGSVFSVRMTSTNFISCTGLKKWMPTNLSSRPEKTDISVIDNDEVLEAKIVSGLHNFPKSVYRSLLRSIFSMTASTIKSVSFNASISVVHVMELRVWSAFSWEIFSFFTNLSIDFIIRSFPLSKNRCSFSKATTLE
mmetsp:Transcript_39613/g.112318  ORF Transcript_39613/g.112318 Transcript_39613/m.112318 type:complete len:204 (+) Transcript_39613:94-705(+)